MNNISGAFRTFIIFAACVVLAVWLGFMLASPVTYSQMAIYGVLAFILFFPVLLRWHYPLLLLSWNMTAIIFFLPGQPTLYLLMVGLSLGISVLQRMISKESQFVRVLQITLPLFCLLAVIVITAKLTGFGIRSLGGEIYGGKKYFYLLGGILGYFALSARQIPLKQKNLYIALYFLGGATRFVGDLVPILPHSFYFIYNIFSYDYYVLENVGFTGETIRLAEAQWVSAAGYSYLLARYGIRGIFYSGKPWRWLVFLLFLVYGLFGGFRGFIVSFALLFGILFFLEGLHRTKWLPIMLVSGLLGGLALIPLSSHLPYTFQRAISFLPYKVSTPARVDAQATMQWRLDMWGSLLPQIPQYLLLGKGYNISPLDYNFVMGPEASIHSTFMQNDPHALAEDFHNGPISVLIPFGIWGGLAMLWFFAVCVRVTYLNYRYSDPTLQTVNTFFFAAIVAHLIFFTLFYGDMSGDMATYCGLLGLSVSLNGGVRRRVRTTQPVPQTQSAGNFARLPSSPAPAFQRQ
jgi:hypothetical protein